MEGRAGHDDHFAAVQGRRSSCPDRQSPWRCPPQFAFAIEEVLDRHERFVDELLDVSSSPFPFCSRDSLTCRISFSTLVQKLFDVAFVVVDTADHAGASLNQLPEQIFSPG